MTKTTSAQAWRRRALEAVAPAFPGRSAGLGKPWHLILLGALLLVLTIPAALLVAPGFLGPEPPAPAPVAPPWQRGPAAPAAAGALAPLDPAAPVPDPSAVSARLEPVLKADGGGSFTGAVQDALTGQVLFDRGGSESRVPASNLKLLTSVAALRALGPDRTFATRVVPGPDANQVVLVGGGDVLLGAGESNPAAVMGRAGLATLAARTVASLQAAGAAGEIKVLLDDSLFSGPALNPAWELGDVAAGEVAPVFPLALNSARYDAAVTTGPRPQDAAMAAADEFAARLRAAGAAAGLTVAAGVDRRPGAGTAGSDADAGLPGVLAEVQSAPVSDQVDLLLQVSDNYLAEVMGRMTAVAAGQPASYDGATAAVRGQLEEAGIPTGSVTLVDACGLAMGNQVSASQFAEVVRAITTGPDSRLRSALDGFPVAGLTGTLDTRYGDQSTVQGAGLVRAKTGTLNTVLALSGYVVDADGRLLVFSFIGNGLTPGAAANKVALDQAATALAGCGCR
ncbi:D-alanyl-D-alanine carboxypeptidase/D-alanyl-D-alanine-endopeptidase [Pseudarthrobacter enclensis]|uniref:D-alanyl-D-alanine carboxypeptidase/D-alanyl-D-alanine endopeptidase n=1 Tax=Pseudarthrobacter enclensis TaxID=993070 RepID=UPI0036850806